MKHYSMPYSIPLTFSELIRKEEELLSRLLLVSQQQLEIVRAGNASLLLDHLAQRERLWHEFELLEQQLAPHKQIPPEKRDWRNDEEKLLTENDLIRCKSLMEEIMTNDQISIKEAAELKDKAEKDLKRIQLSKSAAPAYVKQSRLK